MDVLAPTQTYMVGSVLTLFLNFFLGLCEFNDVMSSSIQRQQTNIFLCVIVLFFPSDYRYLRQWYFIKDLAYPSSALCCRYQ